MKKKKKVLIGVVASLSVFAATTTVVLASNGPENTYQDQTTQVRQQDNQDGRYGNMMENNKEYGKDNDQRRGGHCHNNREENQGHRGRHHRGNMR